MITLRTTSAEETKAVAASLAALGAELMTVRLEWVGTDEPDLRLVSIAATGDRWTARWPRVQSALAAWVAG